MAVFYDFSGGMESTAMLVLERERILDLGAIVRFADTGKQFPELYQSFRQIEFRLRIQIVIAPRRLTFEEFFEAGGMIRQGTTDCSRRMKRSNLSRHMRLFPKPYEINLGYNAGEKDRAEEFTDRNERPWCHWRFPLIEAGTEREATWEICRDAGLSVVIEMYEKMGRMDCFFCGNQTPRQALKVVDHYPEFAREWIAAEDKKGHSFMSVPLRVLIENRDRQGMLDLGNRARCACFGGTDDALEDFPQAILCPSGKDVSELQSSQSIPLSSSGS